MPSGLAAKTRTAVPTGAPPLEGIRLKQPHEQLGGWEILEQRRLTRTFPFPDFAAAPAFVNHLVELAEQQDHHPGIHLSWGKVTVELSTHVVKGSSENDFILAAKIDALPR